MPPEEPNCLVAMRMVMPSAASGFALGRSQKVRLTKKLHKILLIISLRSVKIKVDHKKQPSDGLYYG